MTQNIMYDALKAQFEAQRQKAIATLTVYFSNSVGIGEHPQHIEEIDKLLQKIVDAQEKIKELHEKLITREADKGQKNTIE